MARINLLPWREQLREERKREFFVLLMGVVIIAAGIVFLVDRNFRGDIRYQQSRNDFLRSQILVLDARIVEINELKQQKEQINARMEVIQDLQGSRPVIVRIFDEMVKALPTGVYFNSLVRTGDRLEIEGIAESNNKVSELMRRLDDSEWFVNPSLQQISAASADANSDQRSANAFSLTLGLYQPGREQEE
ncbi:MAG: PilN domain-containing protein [Pseudohongiellaceae bacterium]|nr:MAG: pilus assembly protein PilN [Gammaproteobacteria bacterium RIFCSPLOWO2_02_FULL_57_10]